MNYQREREMPQLTSPLYMEDNTFDRLDRKPIYYEKAALGNRMFLNDFAMQDTNAFYI